MKQNSQWAIAFEVATRAGWVQPDADGYINRQYERPKAALRPVFDVLRQELSRLGDDVDLGLRLTDVPAAAWASRPTGSASRRWRTSRPT